MTNSTIDIFNVAGVLKPKYSGFDLTHSRKFTCEAGLLVPILCQDIIPGDVFKARTDMLVRLAPQLAPVMHNVDVFTHYFFVPNRLVWDNWEKFITGGEDGMDNSVAPYFEYDDPVAPSSLSDYFNIPTDINKPYINAAGQSVKIPVSALPFRAYDLIYNEWFRDEDLCDPVVISKADGLDTTTSRVILNRAWEKDYFTSARPSAQKGPEVRLPLTGDATVKSNDKAFTVANLNSEFNSNMWVSSHSGFATVAAHSNLVDTGPLRFGKESGLVADMGEVQSATINDIRKSFQIQKFFERNMRAGSRYVEFLFSHFGVHSKDARLQRPEYLGGGRSPIMFSEVLQTASTNDTSPQGNMAGHAFSAHQSHGFKHYFEEHGWLIGLVSIMPRTAYQQGLPRQFSRSSKFDYFFPEFQNLGEQEVKKKELYVASTDPEATWGYQGRYQEYRNIESSVHGEFRNTLNYWHMGRIFDNEPQLNEEFIKCNATKRVFAVTEGDHYWVDLYNVIKAFRKMSKVAEPGFIDHN